ncbi:hypothetical protein [Mycobacterium sp. IDR2000157661]|uniref:hypothetical protein n=1 Tax=Mycobacterium sp. IDR2000157661 TaxID=2867005 RepID=UPI001EEB87FF|nr:hypothetical protein [Mycobacterium sp. IDR2000157661]ULE33623.1 hypothetical protein K3G64_02625 [Mycobacterium sp. IDR2000157661]
MLVAIGAGAASMVLLVAWRRRWGWRTVLLFNVVVSALAGAVAGALGFVNPESPLAALLSYGLLGTAAPFLSTLLPPTAPRDVAEVWSLLRRSAGILALTTLCGATAASATYMVIAGAFFYLRATH